MKDQFFADFDIVVTRPVAWGEMDAFQHVNNVTYFRYFEDVRIAHFASLGLLGKMEEDGIGPILASTQCRFKVPLRYPDTVWIGSRIRDVGEDRFLMEYQVVSEEMRRVAALGEGLVVCFDYKAQTKTKIPEGWGIR